MKLSTRTTTCIDFDNFMQLVTGPDDCEGIKKEDYKFMRGAAMKSTKGNSIGVFKHDKKPIVLIQMIRPFIDGGNQATSFILSPEAANALRLLLEKL